MSKIDTGNITDCEGVVVEHYEGRGCNCGAYSGNECGCIDADWRSVREVQLEAKTERLAARLESKLDITQTIFAKGSEHMERLELENAKMCKALTLLRDSEWVLSPTVSLGAVRDIAREALRKYD